MQEATIHLLPALTAKEKTALAMQAEKNGDVDRAIELYEQAIQKKPLDEIPHKRLMVIYRKAKHVKEEIKIIDRAIKIWKAYFDSLQSAMHAGHPARAKIKKLSASIEKKLSATHVDPEPIAGWLKRKKLLKKRIEIKKLKRR